MLSAVYSKPFWFSTRAHFGKAHTRQPVVLRHNHVPRLYPVDEGKVHAVSPFIEHQRLRTFPLDLVSGVAQDDDRND